MRSSSRTKENNPSARSSRPRMPNHPRGLGHGITGNPTSRDFFSSLLERRLADLRELLVADAQLVQAALLCRDDSAVDLAAIEEDRGEDVEEDERQHRGR